MSKEISNSKRGESKALSEGKRGLKLWLSGKYPLSPDLAEYCRIAILFLCAKEADSGIRQSRKGKLRIELENRVRAGISTEENIAWLEQNDRQYIQYKRAARLFGKHFNFPKKHAFKMGALWLQSRLWEQQDKTPSGTRLKSVGECFEIAENRKYLLDQCGERGIPYIAFPDREIDPQEIRAAKRILLDYSADFDPLMRIKPIGAELNGSVRIREAFFWDSLKCRYNGLIPGEKFLRIFAAAAEKLRDAINAGLSKGIEK